MSLTSNYDCDLPYMGTVLVHSRGCCYAERGKFGSSASRQRFLSPSDSFVCVANYSLMIAFRLMDQRRNKRERGGRARYVTADTQATSRHWRDTHWAAGRLMHRGGYAGGRSRGAGGAGMQGARTCTWAGGGRAGAGR